MRSRQIRTTEGVIGLDPKVQYVDLGSGAVVALSRRDALQPANYSMRRTGPHKAQGVANIADFAATVGFSTELLVMPRRWPHLGRVMQVDHNNVLPDALIGLNPSLEKADKPGYTHSCDGLVTATPGLCLGVQGADCPMLFLYDPFAFIVGVVHCGWKSVAHHIIRQAVANFALLGARPSTIRAYVSAGAGDDVYEFNMGDSVRRLLVEQGRLADFQAKLHTPQGRRVLRLNALVVSDLLAAGLTSANIENDPRSCIEEQTLHSYRRDGGPDMAMSEHGLGIGVMYLT